MPLSREDCVDLVREIEALLRENDPGLLELVLRATERHDDPRHYVVDLLKRIRGIYSERSGGTYGRILDGINEFVRLQDGSPVRALSVTLSPAERELYETDEVNFAELPDRSEFLASLDRIVMEIMRETEPPRERQ
jgi:hypothetical protein